MASHSIKALTVGEAGKRNWPWQAILSGQGPGNGGGNSRMVLQEILLSIDAEIARLTAPLRALLPFLRVAIDRQCIVQGRRGAEQAVF